MMPKILMLTDDPQLFLMLRHLLSVEGFDAELLVTPCEGLAEKARSGQDPAVLLIDGSADGIPVYSHFKELYRTFPIVLLERGNIGATPDIDDQFDLVLRWPFEPSMLLQFLKRYRNEAGLFSRPGEIQQVLTYCDLLLNRSQFKVFRNGRAVNLTPLQFRLLETLMHKPETVWSRQELIGAAWENGADVEPRTVDIHIGYIRRALARHGANLIRTVHAHGYALDQSAEPLPTAVNS